MASQAFPIRDDDDLVIEAPVPFSPAVVPEPVGDASPYRSLIDDLGIEGDEPLSVPPPVMEADGAPPVSGPELAAFDDTLADESSESLIVELAGDRIRACRRQARGILGSRLQRAELLITGPEWTVMRTLRAPALPQVDPERTAVMAGVIGEGAVPLIDTIAFLSQGHYSGALRLADGDLVRTAYLHDGSLVWATSSVPDERLGPFLVRRERLSVEALGELMHADPDHLCRQCVARDLVTAPELRDALEALHAEIFAGLATMRAGLWTFSRVPEEELVRSPIRTPAEQLLMAGVVRDDEAREYRDVIRSLDLVIRRVDGIGTREAYEALPQELIVPAHDLLQLLQTEVTIRELVEASNLSEHEVCRIVFRLGQTDLVEILPSTAVHDEPSAPAMVPTTQLVDAARVYGMAIREIYEDVDERGETTDLHGATRAFLASPHEPKPAKVLGSVRIDGQGRLDEHALAMSLPSMSLAALTEPMDQLLMNVMLNARDILRPHRGGDDLCRRVRAIRGMLAPDGPNPIPRTLTSLLPRARVQPLPLPAGCTPEFVSTRPSEAPSRSVELSLVGSAPPGVDDAEEEFDVSIDVVDEDDESAA